MHMQDWIIKLDNFLSLNEREILTHAGKISHQQAIDKALGEYDKYHTLTVNEPSLVEQHFIEALQTVHQLENHHQKSNLP